MVILKSIFKVKIKQVTHNFIMEKKTLVIIVIKQNFKMNFIKENI